MQLLSKELKDSVLYLRISGILATLEERISYANVTFPPKTSPI